MSGVDDETKRAGDIIDRQTDRQTDRQRGNK